MTNGLGRACVVRDDGYVRPRVDDDRDDGDDIFAVGAHVEGASTRVVYATYNGKRVDRVVHVMVD